MAGVGSASAGFASDHDSHKIIEDYTDAAAFDPPLEMRGTVIHGFGRGSKTLGIPTANLKPAELGPVMEKVTKAGVYFGWAGLNGKGPYRMVMSIGWNPHFKNKERTVEPHLLHDFGEDDFYGEQLSLKVTGYLRPEKSYDSLEALIAAIHSDIEKTKLELSSASALEVGASPWLLEEPAASSETPGAGAAAEARERDGGKDGGDVEDGAIGGKSIAAGESDARELSGYQQFCNPITYGGAVRGLEWTGPDLQSMDNDPVEREFDVYLNQDLADQLMCLQFPLKKSDRPVGIPKSVQIKPANLVVKAEYPIDMNPDMHYNEDASLPAKSIRSQKFTSSIIPRRSMFAMMTLRHGEVHLTPVRHLMRMEVDRTDMDTWSHNRSEDLGELQAKAAEESRGTSSASRQMAAAARARALTARNDGRGLSQRQEMMQADLLLEAEPWRGARVCQASESALEGLPRLFHRAGGHGSLSDALTARQRLARARSRSVLDDETEAGGGSGSGSGSGVGMLTDPQLKGVGEAGPMSSAALSGSKATEDEDEEGGEGEGEGEGQQEEDAAAGSAAAGNGIMTLSTFVESVAPGGRPLGMAQLREKGVTDLSAHDLRRVPLDVLVPEIVRRAGVLRFRDVREFVPRATAGNDELIDALKVCAVCVAGVWVQRSDVWAREVGRMPSLRGIGATAGVGGVGSLAEAVNGAGVDAEAVSPHTLAHRAKLRDYILWRFHQAQTAIAAKARGLGAGARGGGMDDGIGVVGAGPAAVTVPALASWTREPASLLRAILKGIAEELPAVPFEAMSALRAMPREESSGWHPTRVLDTSQADQVRQDRGSDCRIAKDQTLNFGAKGKSVLRSKQALLARAYNAIGGDPGALEAGADGSPALTNEQASKLIEYDAAVQILRRREQVLTRVSEASIQAAEGGGSRQLPRELVRHGHARRWTMRYGGDADFLQEHPAEAEDAESYWARRGPELVAMEARADDALPGSNAGMEARLGMSVSRAEAGAGSRASALVGDASSSPALGVVGAGSLAGSNVAVAASGGDTGVDGGGGGLGSPVKRLGAGRGGRHGAEEPSAEEARGSLGDRLDGPPSGPLGAGPSANLGPTGRKRSLSIGSTGSAFQRRASSAEEGGDNAGAGTGGSVGAASGGGGRGGAGVGSTVDVEIALERFAAAQLQSLAVLTPGWLAQHFRRTHASQVGDSTGDRGVVAALTLDESELLRRCRIALSSVGHGLSGQAQDVFIETRAAMCERGARGVTSEEIGLVWDAAASLMESSAKVQKRQVRARAEELAAEAVGSGSGDAPVSFLEQAFIAVMRRVAVSSRSSWVFKNGEHLKEGAEED